MCHYLNKKGNEENNESAFCWMLTTLMFSLTLVLHPQRFPMVDAQSVHEGVLLQQPEHLWKCSVTLCRPSTHQLPPCSSSSSFQAAKAPGARGTPALSTRSDVWPLTTVIPGCRSQTGPGGSRTGWWRRPPCPGCARQAPWGESHFHPRIWNSHESMGKKRAMNQTGPLT